MTRPISKLKTVSLMSSPKRELAFLKSIWDSSTEYSLIAEDLQGTIIAWNEGAKRIYGYQMDEVIGKSCFILHNREDIQSGKAQAILNEASEKEKWEGKVNSVRRDGSHFVAYLTITLRYDLDGNPIGFTMISREAPGSLKPLEGCEENLKDSQADLKNTQDELIGAKDKLKASQESLQGSRDELKSSQFDIKNSSDELETSQCDLKGSQDDLKGSQEELRESEGVNYRLVEHIKSQNKKLISVNKELVEQNHRSQEANRLKSEFLANMSHELRTPLNGIIGFSELIQSGKVGPVSVQHKEYLGDILLSGRHLMQLINDVLDLSKVESGKMEFHPESFDVEKIVNEVCNILRTLLVEKRMGLEIKVDPLMGKVNIDPARFKQVLYNFLSNAIKFSPAHGKVTVRVCSEGHNDFKLEIKDTGIGIHDKDLDKLFIEFQQLDATIAKKYQGTGLGLALTRRIVVAQGGSVGVKSEFGKGSCFYAILPKHHSVPESNIKSLKRVSIPFINTPSILVIDDDPNDLEDLGTALVNYGYEVITAKNGGEAVNLFRRQKFSAITLDLILPDMSGFDILRILRSEGPNQLTPVIVVSVIAEKSTSAGYQIHDFLVKPVLPEELIFSLSNAGILAYNKNLVLVVDDEPRELELIKQELRLNGYQVIIKQDGKSGLISVEEDYPSIIVLDLLMPEMDGFQFLESLKKIPIAQKIPVIIWTNKDLTNEEKKLLHSYSDGLIPKAAGSKALLNEIERYLPKLTVQPIQSLRDK